jgi:hypothetical protein
MPGEVAPWRGFPRAVPIGTEGQFPATALLDIDSSIILATALNLRHPRTASD